MKLRFTANPFLLGFTLILGTLVAASATDLISKTEPPNIIIILADDMGYSDLGCMGSEIETPNLDQQASEGVLFSHFYNASVCCLSRASLLTGQWQWDAGMGAMSPSKSSFPEYQGYINSKSVTIAEALKLVDYQTFMVGKWHLATNVIGGRTGEASTSFTAHRPGEVYIFIPRNPMIVPCIGMGSELRRR